MSGGGRRFLVATAAAAAAMLPLLVMVASLEAGVSNPAALATSTSTGSPAPLVNNSPPPEPQLHLASVPGCQPKELADSIVINCRGSSRPTMTPTEECCIVAVGIVARPACYCLVEQEVALRISPLLNKTNMIKLVASCGATPLLHDSLYTPCGGSSHDNQTMGDYGCGDLETVTILNGCSLYKIAAFIECPLIAILIAVLLWLMFWRPVPVAPVVEGKKALIVGKKALRW